MGDVDVDVRLPCGLRAICWNFPDAEQQCPEEDQPGEDQGDLRGYGQRHRFTVVPGPSATRATVEMPSDVAFRRSPGDRRTSDTPLSAGPTW